MSTEDSRQADHVVAPLFINRWSPRAYSAEEIPDDVLLSIFEAARWAPSARNVQPWRFLYAKRQSPDFATFLDLLVEQNQVWARRAAALVVLLSAKTFRLDGQDLPLSSHSFDTGAAWANLALQGNLLGWHSHAMGGFYPDKARIALRIPEEFAIEVIIAIGKIGDKETLPPGLRAREVPTPRRALGELVTEGAFRQ